MVPIGLYKILDKTKKEIARRFEEIKVELNPIDFAWLLYALQYEADTLLFLEKFEKLKRWSLSDMSEKSDRNIGALSLCVYLMKKLDKGNYTEILEKIRKILKRNLYKDKIAFRHNVLNDPGEMFLLSTISDCLEENVKSKLLEISIKNITGPVPRKILFLASSVNLGVKWSEIENTVKKVFMELRRVEDTITALWFCKKFDKLTENISQLLNKLDKTFFILEERGRIFISTQYLALLCEALNKELIRPHPLTLFSLYPFEEELRKICEGYFKSEKYSTAVSEALKKLKEFLKQKARKSGADPDKIKKLETKERELIRWLLNPRIPQKYQRRNPKEIPIKITELESIPEVNFQEGLALLLEGLWVAFRHPEAHYPEDHWIRKMDPFEALSILTLIDYLLKRIKKS